MAPRHVLILGDAPAALSSAEAALPAPAWRITALLAGPATRRGLPADADVVVLACIRSPEVLLQALREAREAGVKAPVVVVAVDGAPDLAARFSNAGATRVIERVSANAIQQAVREAVAPLRSIPVLSEPAPPTTRPATARVVVRVLVVAAEKSARENVVHLLHASEDLFHVDDADSAARGIRLATTRGYDVILLASDLRDMDAVLALQGLRTRDVRVPVLMTAPNADEATRTRLLRAGATDVLPAAASTGPALLAAIRSATWRARLGGGLRSAAGNKV